MMTVERLLEYTTMDGLVINLTPSGQLELEGAPDCVAFWTVFVSEYREQIIKVMEGKG